MQGDYIQALTWNWHLRFTVMVMSEITAEFLQTMSCRSSKVIYTTFVSLLGMAFYTF